MKKSPCQWPSLVALPCPRLGRGIGGIVLLAVRRWRWGKTGQSLGEWLVNG